MGNFFLTISDFFKYFCEMHFVYLDIFTVVLFFSSLLTGKQEGCLLQCPKVCSFCCKETVGLRRSAIILCLKKYIKIHWCPFVYLPLVEPHVEDSTRNGCWSRIFLTSPKGQGDKRWSWTHGMARMIGQAPNRINAANNFLPQRIHRYLARRHTEFVICNVMAAQNWKMHSWSRTLTHTFTRREKTLLLFDTIPCVGILQSTMYLAFERWGSDQWGSARSTCRGSIRSEESECGEGRRVSNGRNHMRPYGFFHYLEWTAYSGAA